MRKIRFASSVFASLALGLLAVTLMVNPVSIKASNIDSRDITSPITPRLPTANVGPNATVAQYLSVAHSAPASGQSGLAQSSLKNAESLALTSLAFEEMASR